MADRAAYKTFRPGDRVTVRQVVRSGKSARCLVPGMAGVVERMGQVVEVRFPQYPNVLWWLYDGLLRHVSDQGVSGVQQGKQFPDGGSP